MGDDFNGSLMISEFMDAPFPEAEILQVFQSEKHTRPPSFPHHPQPCHFRKTKAPSRLLVNSTLRI